MSFFPGNDPTLGNSAEVDAIEQLIIPRTSDIGSMEVRRALPSARRRLVGPFIFFDRMGPALLRAGQAMEVRPHPHIGLSTVTYLFDGQIKHRDSLGVEMVIEPGDVNLMTAGRGIVHSERSPENLAGKEHSISGLQTWLALPDGMEEIDPKFSHIDRGEMPQFEASGVNGRLIIGNMEGMRSPVNLPTETLYLDIRLQPGATFQMKPEWEERAVYVLEGGVTAGGTWYEPDQLLVLKAGVPVEFTAGREATHLMFFGGDAMDSQRYIWWNFVSSSKERIEQAKEEWRTGKFDIVPGDEEDFIPLPEG
ncbi:pirin family protein [Rhizobium sp. L1K21]|uniref:pirin family protein n=1 Tax=Rhizobium sp. L1K21 TaxID=2954933 RepID=UPI00209222C9|nr:pirin family protein [Rhizobium sp. L1K21]MCO6186874.1 pirin family protein [Rhizobium sp. L1K21]